MATNDLTWHLSKSSYRSFTYQIERVIRTFVTKVSLSGADREIIRCGKVALLSDCLTRLDQVSEGQRLACGDRHVVIKMNSYSATRHQRQKTR